MDSLPLSWTMDRKMSESTIKSDNEHSISASYKSSQMKGSEHPKPPTTYEEFLISEGLKEWPVPVDSEVKIDYSKERQLFGDPENFISMLKEATPINSERLTALENRLESFDSALYTVTKKMLASVDDIAAPEVPPLSPRKSSVPLATKRGNFADRPKAITRHPSEAEEPIDVKEKVVKEKVIQESQRKAVDQCEYPGFQWGELTDLPNGLQATQILRRVSKAQNFNNTDKEGYDPAFRKFWKKIFQSDASIGMMQDSFWWIYMELFQRGKKKPIPCDQSRVFDRMAENFVALFSNINEELKEKTFAEYPNCLAQALYSVYCEAFPESKRLFGDLFKQFLCNITMEWVSGMRAPPGVYESWNIKELEPKIQRESTFESLDYSIPSFSTTQTISQQDSGAGVESYEYLINEFFGVLESLGGMKFDRTFSPDRDRMNSPNRETSGLSPLNEKLPTIKEPKSTAVRKGPDLQSDLFDLEGKSQLVTHYLRKQRIRAAASSTNVTRLGATVSRHQQQQLTPSLSSTDPRLSSSREKKATSQTGSKERDKVSEMTDFEIKRIERNTRETNRKIEKLQRDLLFCKNSLEVKLMGDQVLKEVGRTGNKLNSQDDSEDDETEIT